MKRSIIRPRGLREQRRKICAENHGCIWHRGRGKCMPGIVGLEAHECCILAVLKRLCMRHFGPGILENKGNRMSRMLVHEFTARKNCHLSRVLAIVSAGRSMGETDRSIKHQAFGPRGLKCCKIRALECCNFGNLQPRLFRVALAKGNVHEIRRDAEFSAACVTPQPQRMKIELRAKMTCPV